MMPSDDVLVSKIIFFLKQSPLTFIVICAFQILNWSASGFMLLSLGIFPSNEKLHLLKMAAVSADLPPQVDLCSSTCKSISISSHVHIQKWHDSGVFVEFPKWSELSKHRYDLPFILTYFDLYCWCKYMYFYVSWTVSWKNDIVNFNFWF